MTEEPHERKFLVDDIENVIETIFDMCLEATSEYSIQQIHIGDIKYRKIERLRGQGQIEYMSYIHKNGKAILKAITEKQWHEIEKSVDYKVINKVRFCFRDPDGWDYDIDIFILPKFMCMIEIDGKGRNIYEFNPPKYFKEVTGDPRYFNKNIFNGSLG